MSKSDKISTFEKASNCRNKVSKSLLRKIDMSEEEYKEIRPHGKVVDVKNQENDKENMKKKGVNQS